MGSTLGLFLHQRLNHWGGVALGLALASPNPLFQGVVEGRQSVDLFLYDLRLFQRKIMRHASRLRPVQLEQTVDVFKIETERPRPPDEADSPDAAVGAFPIASHWPFRLR